MRRLQGFFVSVLMAFCAAGSAVAQNLPNFADLAEQQSGVVVNISTTQVVRERAMPIFPFDGEIPEIFRHFFPHGQQGAPRESERHSLGSGFIISEDGYVLTNAHVVDGADEVIVRLKDKREFQARIVGADKRTDVALLKVEVKGLSVARLGDPEKLRVGEWVAAIGSPFGLESTVTAGIVSAKGRSLPQENYVPFIQTDVAVNPGNSGGPLFNLNGEVMGINSQIYSRSGGYMGLSFAIPIDVAMDVQRQLRESGRVSRGRIGVVIQDVSRELAESFGLEKPTGAIVSAVEQGGPADKAGIVPGDVILRFNEKLVENSSELPRAVANIRPGTKVPVRLWRKGQEKSVTVAVGEIDEAADRVAQNDKGRSGTNRLGLVVRELSPAERQKVGVKNGLQIEEARGIAARELRVGDLILAVIAKGVSHELSTVEQFNKLLAQFSKDASVTLLVRRGEIQTFVTLKGN